MRVESLRTAIAEAERFLRKAKAIPLGHDEYVPYPSVEAAACKRASLDLSRALSELRRP